MTKTQPVMPANETDRVRKMVAFLLANQHRINRVRKGAVSFNFAGKSLSYSVNETGAVENQ